MDQTNTNIGASSIDDKSVTNIANAMDAAKAKKAKVAAAAKAAPKPGVKQDNKQNTVRASVLQGKRTIVSFETARRICPTEGMIANIVRRFGVDGVDYDGIRTATQQNLADSAKILADNMGERSDKALDMHMQRTVDAYVRSAHGAGSFFDGKAKAARDATSAIANQDRDEDREGVDSTENKAQQACRFAAQVAVQAYAVLAAAHGAIDAYAHVCGRDWKPYEGSQNQDQRQSIGRQAITMQADAFTRD